MRGKIDADLVLTQSGECACSMIGCYSLKFVDGCIVDNLSTKLKEKQIKFNSKIKLS